jgi:hypothetical protein
VFARLSQGFTPSHALRVEAKGPKVNVSPLTVPLPDMSLQPSLPLKVPSSLIVRFGCPAADDPQVPVKDEPGDEHPVRATIAATAARARAARAGLRLIMPHTVVVGPRGGKMHSRPGPGLPAGMAKRAVDRDRPTARAPFARD